MNEFNYEQAYKELKKEIESQNKKRGLKRFINKMKLLFEKADHENPPTLLLCFVLVIVFLFVLFLVLCYYTTPWLLLSPILLPVIKIYNEYQKINDE